jgi:SET domain-containing protein
MQHPGIELIRSGIHGTGVRATRPFAKGERVIEYVGRKLTNDEAKVIADHQFQNHKRNPHKGAVYVFEIDDQWSIDGDVPDNIAKYINHSCDPNCEVEITAGHIYIAAGRDIKAGEEITYNYCFDLDDIKDDLADYTCRCGSPKCVGYILDDYDWPRLRELLKERS